MGFRPIEIPGSHRIASGVLATNSLHALIQPDLVDEFR
jgi:hypothetical protein